MLNLGEGIGFVWIPIVENRCVLLRWEFHVRSALSIGLDGVVLRDLDS